MVIRPPLRYHGSKWRLAPWIISHFPPHRVYVEVFGGSAAVLLRKERSEVEIYNDLNDDLYNFFRVVRDRRAFRLLAKTLAMTGYARKEYDLAYRKAHSRIERARRLVVRCFMGFGSNSGTVNTKSGFRAWDWNARNPNNLYWPKVPGSILVAHQRLQGVVIENRPALRLMQDQDSPTTLFYLDPPYVAESRSSWHNKRSYGRFEMTDTDHRELAAAIRRLQGHVVLSGYHSPLYEELFGDWPRVETETHTQGNAERVYRTEVLWMAPRTHEALTRRELFAKEIPCSK